MKKIFLSIFIISLIVFIVYLFFRLGGNDELNEPDSYVDRSFLLPDVVDTSLPMQDITTLLLSEPSPALNRVINSIYRDSYEVMTCKDEIGGGKALLMTALFDGSIARDGYDKAFQDIKNWESNAVAEIGHIVFPSLARQTASINFVWFEPYQSTNQHILARDFHKADFYVEEQPYEMHYGWTLNYVIFAPSQACLEGAMMELYHVH